MAIWEGLLFGWFLFVIYIAAMNLDQAADYFWREMPANHLPRMTIWVRIALPDELLSLLTCWVTSSIGFGLISFSSHEAFSSRLFRWVVITSMTIFLALAIPIMAQFKILSGGPDTVVWDEILFVCLGLCLLTTGIIQVRSASSSS
ncbi:MAG: hypothetical protein R3F13_19160 [Prosthecobacter sp.]